VQPRDYKRIDETAAAGIPWAADNDCYQGLDTPRYTAMLGAIAPVPGCLFCTVPDVVGDAWATAQLFDLWAPQVHGYGLPVCLVAQDGITILEDWLTSVWPLLRAVFIGGTTEFKLGTEGRWVAEQAKQRGLWLHMGRVNSRRRYEYARRLGCNSVDGSGFSRWRDTWLPDALTWHRQLRLEEGE
jgi:hypothetical protein